MTKRLLPLLLCCAVLAAGCAKKQVLKAPPVASNEQAARVSDDEPSNRADDWLEVPELASVRFDFDSIALSAEARAALQKNAEYFRANPHLTLRVEGHCDERGTVEYNLGLGQRRARAVRDYYAYLGLPLNRIATISYGKEVPAEPGNTEAAWAKNRRAVTKARGFKSKV